MPSRSSSKGEQKRAARERVEQMRREQAAKDRRQRLALMGTTGVIAVVIIGLAAWAVARERADVPEGALPTVTADGRTTEPPWSLPPNPAELAQGVGLRVAPMEANARHFHAHLDVLVNGEAVTVPANIGIDPSGNGMSELHTHDERGVLHVEAPSADMRYTLGQLFAEWDVRLDEQGIGGLEADDSNTLRAYVDGEQVDGSPANIELTEHRQIALVYGPADEDVDVPDSYDFQPGE